MALTIFWSPFSQIWHPCESCKHSVEIKGFNACVPEVVTQTEKNKIGFYMSWILA